MTPIAQFTTAVRLGQATGLSCVTCLELVRQAEVPQRQRPSKEETVQ